MSALSEQLKQFLPAAGDDICDNLKKAAQFELEWIRIMKKIFVDENTFTTEFKEAYCGLGCANGSTTTTTTSGGGTTTSTTTAATSGERSWVGGAGIVYGCGDTFVYKFDTTFTVPDGVYSIHAQCWGGGGAGGSATAASSASGGGGGGGEYRECDIAVTPGEILNLEISYGGVIQPTCGLVPGFPDGIPIGYTSNSSPTRILRGATVLVRAATGSMGGPPTGTTGGVAGSGGTGGAFGIGTSGQIVAGGYSGVAGQDYPDCDAGAGGPPGQDEGIYGIGGTGTLCGIGVRRGGAGAGGKIIISWT